MSDAALGRCDVAVCSGTPKTTAISHSVPRTEHRPEYESTYVPAAIAFFAPFSRDLIIPPMSGQS